MPGKISAFYPEEQRAIKEKLWNGTIQRVVAEEANLALPTIQSIIRGSIWYNVPWPDGSVGPMTDERRREISLIRYVNTRKKTRHFKSAIAMRYEDKKTEEDIWLERAAIGALQAGKFDDEGNILVEPVPNPTREQIIEVKNRIREAKK